jgi:hypothetical protein
MYDPSFLFHPYSHPTDWAYPTVLGRRRFMQVSRLTLVVVLLVALGSALANAVRAVTLDFEELQSDIDILVGPVYSAEGMTLTVLPPPQAPNA